MRVTVQFRSRVLKMKAAFGRFFYFMYFLYILYSQKLDRYYIGSSEDVVKRLERHNAGSVTSTRSGLPWEVKYTESFETRSEALQRELAIKRKKSRVYIEWLIATKKG